MVKPQDILAQRGDDDGHEDGKAVATAATATAAELGTSEGEGKWIWGQLGRGLGFGGGAPGSCRLWGRSWMADTWPGCHGWPPQSPVVSCSERKRTSGGGLGLFLLNGPRSSSLGPFFFLLLVFHFLICLII